MGLANITNNILVDSGILVGNLTPTTRNITINGVGYDLSADRSWTIAAGVSSLASGTGISVATVNGVATVTNLGLLSAASGTGIVVSTVNQQLTVTNTGLLSAASGTGIAVSTSNQQITITNLGLLSAASGTGIAVSTVNQQLTITNTGILSLVSGTGIVVSTTNGVATITNLITNNNQLTNGAGYITSSALSGYATQSYVTSQGYITSSSLSSYLPLSGGTMSGTLTLASISGTDQTVENTYGAYLHLGAWGVGRTDATAVLVNTAYRADYATDLFDMNISRFTNNSGYITSSALNSYLPLSGGTLSGNLYVTNSSTVGAIFISGAQGGARQYMIQNGITGISNSGLQIRDVTGNASLVYFDTSYNASFGAGIWATSGNFSAAISASNISSGVNASHIVQRDGNGYIYANHINFNTPESENPAISSFITSNGDGWSRKSSLQHVRNQLGNYGGWITSSGSITGNAATATYATNATRLYASDGSYVYGGAAPYYMTMTYDGSRWLLQVTPATPAAVRVAYADSAGTSSQVTVNYNNDSNSTYQLLWGSGNSVYGTAQVYVNPSSDIIYARGGYISPGNAWGTGDSAFFPNGITTAGGTNWVYGLTYLGNAPGNGSGVEVASNGRIYVRANSAAASHGFSGLFVDRNSASSNFIPWSFENEYGNHSWGIVARFRISQSGADRPSIQFSSASSDTRWNLGYNTGSDDHFRITQNMGYRNDNSTSDGWGTERFRVNTDGNTLIFASLGIGGITPDVRLSVNGDAHVSNIMYMAGTAGSVGSWGTRTYGYSGDWTTNARTVRFDNVGYGSSWAFTIDASGNAQSSASMRAPIFYDSNDTSYYVDPNSLSRIYRLQVIGDWAGGNPNEGAINIRGAYPSMTFRNTVSGNMWLRHMDGSGDIQHYFAPSGVDATNWSIKHTMFTNGNFYSSGSHTASQFNGSGAGLTGTASSLSVNYANSAGSVAWGNVSGRPTTVSSFSNDSGYITSSGSISGNAQTSNHLNSTRDTPSSKLQYWDASGLGIDEAPSGDWHNTIRMGHGSPLSYYSNTLAIRMTGSGVGDIYTQTIMNGVRQGWKRHWNDSNMDAPNKAGTSYYQVNTWLQMNGTHGLYWPSYYGAHLYVNTTTSYTQFRWDGNKNGYDGVWLSYSAVNGMMYDSAGNGGVYREANGLWYWYYHVGNNCMGVGTSTTSSSYKMYVNGTVYATGDVIAYSDRRKKTNIETIENALEKVTSLRGVFYDKIGEEDKGRQLGVIAQEVDQVLPEAVSYAKDIDEYGVKYGNMVGLLIEAMKEQQTQIEDLKSKLDAVTK